MRLPILLIGGSLLVGTSWKFGTRMGDVLADAYIEWLENVGDKLQEKTTKLDSVK